MAHDACETAKARGFDVLIVDTAGRLHTQTHLMGELEKIQRVIGRQYRGRAARGAAGAGRDDRPERHRPGARRSRRRCSCTGIVLTKLDGTAKGGVDLRASSEARLPVKFVGVGEKLDDLEPFDPEAYVDALFGA